MRDAIAIKGARENNLRNIDVRIPRDKLVVITGISGSGKSSLAFDTVYAEGQRRFMESMSTYAKRFVEQMKKPDVDFVTGLSPVISIEQKTIFNNPRSTVGTMTACTNTCACSTPRWARPTAPIDRLPHALPDGRTLAVPAGRGRGRNPRSGL